MKRLLFCVVALIAVAALVAPTYAAEMNINGINRIKFISAENMDGDDDTDDNANFVKQRLRMYFTSVASENLKVVYKNEIDFEWGDNSFATGRSDGGRLGGDTVNLETKNLYMEFMVPDTPLKTTLGLQGITLHKGWFISDDISAARFDLNFDPVSVMAYWGIVNDQDFTDASDDIWQAVASGAYKAENLDARLSFGYEKGQDDPNVAVKSDDFFLVMGELNMSFDMFSFFVIGAANFGERDGDNSDAGKALDRDYSGYMFHAGVNFALDMATIRAQAFYASGENEETYDSDGDGVDDTRVNSDDDFRTMSGQTFSWAEIVSDGYFWEANSNMTQISSVGQDYNPPGHSASNHPSNVIALDVGADFKATDTTTISADIWYITMVEDRTVGGSDEDDVGIEIDAKVVQKVYDNLDLLIVGAYMIANDGYGTDALDNSGDDAYVIGMGLNYKF